MKEYYSNYVLIQDFGYIPALIRHSSAFKGNYNITYFGVNYEHTLEWYCGSATKKLYSSKSLHQLAIL